MEIREVVESELRATKCRGTDSLMSGLLESGFLDEACSDGHDTGRGGLVNHTLWVLRLARRELKRILENRPELSVTEESVAMLCLMYGFTKSAASIPGLSEITLSADEKTALDNVRYRAVAKNAEPSSPDSETVAALLHYILRESVRLAVEYADGIPFCGKAEDVVRPELLNDGITACFEPEDHRTWWNAAGDSYSDAGIDTESLIQMPVHRLFSLSLGPTGDGNVADLAVLTDDYGAKALLPLYSSRNGQILMRSDRACFDYRNCVFLISRFPHYRSSYIIAQRIDGKWGAFSIKRELSQDKVPAVRMTGVLHFDCRSFDEALNKLCRNSGRRTFQIRVTDPDFYYRFSVTDVVRH